jgi:hypothetical protein
MNHRPEIKTSRIKLHLEVWREAPHWTITVTRTILSRRGDFLLVIAMAIGYLVFLAVDVVTIF